MISQYNKVVILFGLALILFLAALVSRNVCLFSLSVFLILVIAPYLVVAKISGYREYGKIAGRFYRIFIKKESEGRLVEKIGNSVPPEDGKDNYD